MIYVTVIIHYLFVSLSLIISMYILIIIRQNARYFIHEILVTWLHPFSSINSLCKKFKFHKNLHFSVPSFILVILYLSKFLSRLFTNILCHKTKNTVKTGIFTCWATWNRPNFNSFGQKNYGSKWDKIYIMWKSRYNVFPYMRINIDQIILYPFFASESCVFTLFAHFV